MSKVHYFADGYLLEKEGEIRQSTWVCIFNPTTKPADLQFTFYYENCPPTEMTLTLPALTCIGRHLLSCKEVHQNVRFGAKVESTQNTVIQITTGYYGLDDKPDWYTRAMHSCICATKLSKTLYYADALVIDQEGQRLKEPEWAFLLNPNKEPAVVKLYAYYGDGIQEIYPFRVEPERVLSVFMDMLVQKNKIFGAKYVCNIPIAIQQTRLIEEEDGHTIRACFSVMARTSLRG
jgi:hypothetical protein